VPVSQATIECRDPQASRAWMAFATASMSNGISGEQRVGTRGHSRMQRDPAGVAVHNFDDHHPVLAVCRGVQPVDALGGEADRSVEPEGLAGWPQTYDRFEIVNSQVRRVFQHNKKTVGCDTS